MTPRFEGSTVDAMTGSELMQPQLRLTGELAPDRAHGEIVLDVYEQTVQVDEGGQKVEKHLLTELRTLPTEERMRNFLEDLRAPGGGTPRLLAWVTGELPSES